MTQTPSPVLRKDLSLPPAQDFYELRRKGIESIVKTGSRQWTDYNLHDPGITILEALCYAITDLAYRIDWDVPDILTAESASPSDPYPNQAFFTARKILPVNPVTPNDLRRVLIDLESVRNAWVLCKECACETSYFAWCENDQLVLGYTPPSDAGLSPVEVSPRGLYEALLELEADPELGDLHDRKIELRSVRHDADGAHTLVMELRFPDISLKARDAWELFIESDAVFADASKFSVSLKALGAKKGFDVFTDSSLQTDADRDNYVRTHWRNVFYATFEIQIDGSPKTILIENVALRVFSDNAVKNATIATDLRTALTDRGAGGFIRLYNKKAQRAHAAVENAKETLQTHRNLDEDFCVVDAIGIEEVAVCADVEVEPDADIERVQAEIWFRIEQYFNPPILFQTLEDARAAGTPVEEIFDGPALESGFIDAANLKDASLRSVVRVSDILDRLMGIDGVIAVNQLLVTKYDSEGNEVKGAADPSWVDGSPVFDANKTSAAWLLFISGRHQPRLYLNLSRFLFIKSGLPFLPRMDEATDALNQLRGEAERPKNPGAPNDLATPRGVFRDPQRYYPVQYSFPLTYGIGATGLPSTASVARRAQAKQLKAYLTVFEQLLGNSLSQLAHSADLFSLDPMVARTYFVRSFDDTVIKGFSELAKPEMTQAKLEAMAETPDEFYERRNRFLDHLLARFGEDFKEYALLLTNAAGEQAAQQRLIDNKIAFLEAYPTISRDRGKAFDYKHAPCAPANAPGIKRRILLRLGFPDLAFNWTINAQSTGQYQVDFQLLDTKGRDWLNGTLTASAGSEDEARQTGYRALFTQMVRADAYTFASEDGGFRLKLQNGNGAQLGEVPQLFETRAEVDAMRDRLMAWSPNDRAIVVEHLLLRPKFPGDALFPACCDGGCSTCGNEDPYSFRLTFVMPGWVAQYTDNLDMRRFADRSIQRETPSHLLGKTCWVGNDGFIENPCDEVIGKLADLLIDHGLTAAGAAPSEDDACECANAVYHAFSTAFINWFADKTLEFLHADALLTLIGAEFAANVGADDVVCTTVFTTALWTEVQSLMTSHFVDVALHGWQFERFENAWCKWLDANALIDWTQERLDARVAAILAANLEASASPAALCECAKSILAQCGSAFLEWMQGNLRAGRTLDQLPDFVPPDITMCPGLSVKPGTAEAIAQLLAERYGAYKSVSYWLSVVVSLLGDLRNTYPGATLHDCDDGSDHNPVRLDNTALGNYPLRTTLT
jgi:hypothetical protein